MSGRETRLWGLRPMAGIPSPPPSQRSPTSLPSAVAEAPPIDLTAVGFIVNLAMALGRSVGVLCFGGLVLCSEFVPYSLKFTNMNGSATLHGSTITMYRVNFVSPVRSRVRVS